MMPGKGKDGLMLAIGVGKKPSKDDKMMGESEDESMEKDEGEFSEFADALFEAVKSDDKEAFKEALRGAVESCMEY